MSTSSSLIACSSIWVVWGRALLPTGTGGETIFLRETARFRSKIKARVRIKQDDDYASYGLNALPASKEQARLGW